MTTGHRGQGQSDTPAGEDEVALVPGGVISRVLLDVHPCECELALPEPPGRNKRLAVRPAVVILRIHRQYRRGCLEFLRDSRYDYGRWRADKMAALLSSMHS